MSSYTCAGDARGKSRKDERTHAGVIIAGTFYLRKVVIITDIQVIGQLIASLGFPIVACGALFWLVNKQDERHKEEMNGLRKTIEDNTNVLTSLKELIQIIVNRENK